MSAMFDGKLAALTKTASNVQRDQSQISELIADLRSHGATWREIGNAIGVTRQAAWHKYGREAP